MQHATDRGTMRGCPLVVLGSCSESEDGTLKRTAKASAAMTIPLFVHRKLSKGVSATLRSFEGSARYNKKLGKHIIGIAHASSSDVDT